MAKTHFTPRTRHSSSMHFWSWRDLNRRLALARDADEEVGEMFAERAREVRDEVVFLLGGGLSEGAQESLGALAEEDMTDFCILVDLAASVELPGVEPLPAHVRRELEVFLDSEPWHSLAVDNDIVVALALLDSVGAQRTSGPWYRASHGLLDVLAGVLEEVNKEQLNRFVGEYATLAQRDHLQLPATVHQVFEALVKEAAARLGVAPPPVA